MKLGRAWAAGGSAAIAAVASGVCLATYHAGIDGPRGPFFTAALLGPVAALAAARWAGARSRLTMTGALVGLLAASPAPVLHALRYANAGAATATGFADAAAFRVAVDPVLSGAARFEAHYGEIVLSVPPGSLGYLRVRRGAPGPSWVLPRGLYAPEWSPTREEVRASLAIELLNGFFVVFETDRLLVQQTRSGAHVTVRDTRDRVNGHPVPLDAPPGAVGAWALTRAGGAVAVTRDGRTVWSGDDVGPFQDVRVGESRTDGEHGGVLRAKSLSYTRAGV